jgi:hypothetical protein
MQFCTNVSYLSCIATRKGPLSEYSLPI